MRTLLFVSCLLFLCGHSGLSQDSSRLDLGRIELSASALQGVTIRGEWLERLPFTRLSEVVDVYFEGTRSNPANTVYVIDGNQVTSPDLYPIQDIEAITYVQNALIVVNGAHQFGPMVVVRTRNGKRQGNGLRAYGQSALLNRKIRDPFGGHSLKTNNVYYHRYGLSGHTQAGRWSANGTAEYLREAQPAPVIAGLEASKPARFHRVRLNAAAGTGWANGGRLQFEVQYLPQAFNYESVTNITSPPLRISRDQHSDESLLHGAASLHLPLTARLQNRLSVHYNRYRLNQEDQDITQDPMNNYQSDKERRGRYSSFLARNTLTYTVTAGELSLQPALGLWFQSARLKLNEEGSFQSSGNINEARSEYLVRPEQFMATPSFTLRYGRQVEWTGGVVSDWSRGVQQRWYPFTTAMIAPWNTAKDSSDWDLRFFGSYAAANVYNVGNILLQDGDHPPIEVANPVTGPNFPVLTVAGGYKGNFAAQAGLRNTWFHGRLGWDYQWDHRKIKALEFGPPAPGFPTVGYRADLHIIRHRIGLNAKLIDRKEVVLESGLYTLMQRTRIVAGGTLPGSSTNPKNAWTGGWTNRILAGPFSAGINVLYNWNRPTVSLPAGNPETKKELLLHSAYVAYALKFRKQQAECYLSTRNPASGRYFQWQEGKRYFAAGVSVQL